MNIDTLNAQFAIPNHLSFIAGKGDIPLIVINNAHAIATVSLLGGQVLTYQLHNEVPVLWLAETAYHRIGKANRGGVPISWPWFSKHKTDASKPAHGFLRTMLWEVVETVTTDSGGTRITMAILENEETRQWWSHPFRVTVQITIDDALDVVVTAHNLSAESVAWGAALHTYFYVSDVEQVRVSGLDGVRYDDTVIHQLAVQAGDVLFSAETDRIYLDTTATTTIHDPILKRNIHVAKSNSNTTVVWNPGTTAQKPDLVAGAYRNFVCIEAVKTGEDVAVVDAGASFAFSTTISTELVM